MSRTKLTVEQAMEIRRRFENLGPGGGGLTSLAVQFHAAKDTIYRILTGEHWLVRGAPDISQARKASGHRPERWGEGVSDRQRKLVASGTPRMSAQQYRIRNACPACGARRGEYCVSMVGGTYQRPIKTVHDERKR